MNTSGIGHVAASMIYLSGASQPKYLEQIFHKLADFARTHTIDDIDALVMSGQFGSQFPQIEEIPSVATLRNWEDRPAAIPGDKRNEVLAQAERPPRRNRS